LERGGEEEECQCIQSLFGAVMLIMLVHRVTDAPIDHETHSSLVCILVELEETTI